jgi:hypothetical protein
MNRILYETRCRCQKTSSVTKKRKSNSRSEGKPLQYPNSKEISSKTFQIKYPNKLSLTAKFILNSFQNKYIYYAIDDILYTFKDSPKERDQLLELLYSPILFLHNNFSVNFLEIWIRQVYLDEISHTNKFLKTNSKGSHQFTSITIQFFYKMKVPIKKTT